MRLQDDAARTQAQTYPLSFDHRILFSDMDAFRHVNNGAIGRVLEEGRAELNMAVFGSDCFTDPPPGVQILFATVTIDYLLPVSYPGILTVCTGVVRVGASSLVHGQAAFQAGRCCALAQAVMVKALDGRPAALAPGERGAAEALLLRTPAEAILVS